MSVRPEHWQILLEASESYIELITNKFNGPAGTAKGQAVWQSVAHRLNSLGFGEKTVDGWRKTLTDWKCKTKAKASALRLQQRGTGGGPPHLPPLTPLEEKLLSLMGTKTIIGDELVSELGFGEAVGPLSLAEPNIEVPDPKSKNEASTSTFRQDHDYLNTREGIAENESSKIGKKRKLNESENTNTPKRRRHENMRHLSNELLDLNEETISLLTNISHNTDNIAKSLDNLSNYVGNIANSLAIIAKNMTNKHQ